jgi:hypothetical protein
MRGIQNLDDAIRGTLDGFLADGSLLPLEQVNSPWSFNFDLAAAVYEKRALSLGAHPSFVKSSVEMAGELIKGYIPICETPVEKIFLPWLVFADYGPDILTTPALVFDHRKTGLAPECDLFIVPQFRFAGYRLDFALFYKTKSCTRILCVECDGGDYHDRTRDNFRDKELARYGVETVRLSGSEIVTYKTASIAKVTDAVKVGMGA